MGQEITTDNGGVPKSLLASSLSPLPQSLGQALFYLDR
jgi:hypothetical protein